jgi:hypothetical protein
VHQAKQFPLPVHFGFAAQGEAVQAFVVAQIPKQRFDGGETLGDHALVLRRLDEGGCNAPCLRSSYGA